MKILLIFLLFIIFPSQVKAEFKNLSFKDLSFKYRYEVYRSFDNLCHFKSYAHSALQARISLNNDDYIKATSFPIQIWQYFDGKEEKLGEVQVVLKQKSVFYKNLFGKSLHYEKLLSYQEENNQVLSFLFYPEQYKEFNSSAKKLGLLMPGLSKDKKYWSEYQHDHFKNLKKISQFDYISAWWKKDKLFFRTQLPELPKLPGDKNNTSVIVQSKENKNDGYTEKYYSLENPALGLYQQKFNTLPAYLGVLISMTMPDGELEEKWELWGSPDIRECHL